MSGSSFWFTVNGSPLSEKTKEMRFCVIPLRDHRLFVLSVILTNLLVRISVFTAINGKRLFLSARSRTGALRDDSLVRHPDNVSGQDLGLWVLRSMYAKNGTDMRKSEKRREEEREERRLLVSVANVSTVFFLDWSYRRTGPRSWTAN